MAGTPSWVKRNRFVAWVSYFAVLLGFAALAMALVAAGSGYRDYALAAGGICAGIAIVGVALYSTTVHRDRAEHHAIPNMLSDCWEKTPPYALHRGEPASVQHKRM